MYRFALRPRWLLGHLAVLALAVVLVSLGLWQLRRLDQRRDHNALVSRRSETVMPLPARGWQGSTEAAGLAFRRVRVRGRYDTANEVLVRFRSNQGLPGFHVLTPMRTARGRIIVNRGWVPVDMGESWPAAAAQAPSGQTTITGLLRQSEPAGRFLPDRPRSDAPLSVGAVNIPGLERRLSVPLYPLYLDLDGGGVRTATFPAALPAPKLDDGPHLAYAAQWFLFAAGSAIGWAILLRSSARRRRRALGR
jgi:cytochrome oxidase assembly protein ShyY1